MVLVPEASRSPRWYWSIIIERYPYPCACSASLRQTAGACVAERNPVAVGFGMPSLRRESASKHKPDGCRYQHGAHDLRSLARSSGVGARAMSFDASMASIPQSVDLSVPQTSTAVEKTDAGGLEFPVSNLDQVASLQRPFRTHKSFFFLSRLSRGACVMWPVGRQAACPMPLMGSTMT